MVKSINSAGAYPPLPYLPLAIPMIVAKLIGMSVEQSVYVMRLVNGFFCVLILYFFCTRAIANQYVVSLVPLIAMTPMVLALWSSVSADALTLTLCFCYVFYSTTLICVKGKDYNWSEYFLLFVLALAIGNSKVGYSMVTAMPILLLFCQNGAVIFKRDLMFKTVFFILCALLSVAASMVWVVLADKSLVYLGNGANPVEQLSYVMHHPLNFMKISLLSVFSFDDLYSAFFPLHYAIDSFLLRVLAVLLILNIFISSIVNPQFKYLSELPVIVRRCIFLTVLTMFVLFAIILSLPLYLTYNPPGYEKILGFQGRYLLPIIPVLMISLMTVNVSEWMIYKKLREHNALFYVIPGVTNVYIIFVMLLH
ncbi:hypothetical protein BBB57_23190 [Kosakonia sacchari]|nr:hypothetical protein BBB57_23190 [Kosakonia sacchari]